jgi:hypothetical protein
MNKVYKHYFTGGGFCHNKDGTPSDRLLWTMFIIGVYNTVVLVFAFGKDPKPSYARDLLLAEIPVLMTLIGAQSYENASDKRISSLWEELKVED